MIIKLTNALDPHRNNTLLINAKHILSVFESDNVVDKKTTERVTNIYTVTQQSWTVKESIDEIYKIINKCKGSCHD